MLSQLVVLCALTTPEPTAAPMPSPSPETVESLVMSGAAAPSSQINSTAFSYTYISAAFGQGDYDSALIEDSDLLAIGGSFEVNEFLFVTAGLGQEEVDVPALGATLDVDTLSLGLGVHTAMSNAVDIYAGLSYLDVSAEVTIPGLGSGAADGTGWLAGAGIRARVASAVELNAGASVIDIEDEDDTILHLGTVIELSNTIGLTGSYSMGDDADALMLGIRFYL